MQFINPLEILQLSYLEISGLIDIDTIRKAKRRLFADIDLSDEGHFNYYGIQLTKGDCERAIEELSNKELKEFYLYLTSNIRLNEFLVNGNEEFFYNFKQESIFKLPEFVNFISPYFAPRFGKALLNAFEDDDVELLKSILKTSFLVFQSDINVAFKGVTNILQNRIENLSDISIKIKNKESIYDDNNIHKVVEFVTKNFPTTLLNSLPIYFQSQILKIANEINYLNVEIWESFFNTKVCQDLLEHILTLNIDGLNKPTFEKNYEIVKIKNQERIEQERNAPTFKKWAATLIELQTYIDVVSSKELPSSLAYSKTKELFSISELNDLPDYFKEIRTQVGYAIRSLSISIWNNQSDLINALHTIKLASQINLDIEAKAKIKQDLIELKELEKKYHGILVCHFCEVNKPEDNSSLEKTIYKVNSRSSFPRRVQFSHTTFLIPRCRSCKEAHAKGNSKFFSYFIGFLIVGVIIGTMTMGNNYFIGGIIGGITGWIIGTIVNRNFFGKKGIKIDSDSTLRSHPLIVEKMKDGWTFSKPSA